MNLVKWFRKNNTKVMAVVVIVLMAGFIGGSYIEQLGRSQKRQTIAYSGGNKITNYDLSMAREEMEILKMLGADYLLRNINLGELRQPDLTAVLLAEVLFADRTISPELSRIVKSTVRTGGYRISSRQINDIYRRAFESDIYWILLTSEAQRAGIRVSNEMVGRHLAQIIPRIFPQATYARVITPIISRTGADEQKILSTFGKALAVLEYARAMCSAEDYTDLEIRHKASWENETLEVEFMRIESAKFSDSQQQPSEEQILEHFNKYRDISPGDVSEENPYGFGYKLADAASFEYMAIKLDDVSSIVTAPTHEEMEEYYEKNRAQFTQEIPADPNDPNSLTTTETRSYAEVADSISQLLKTNRIDAKADAILQEAKTISEAQWQPGDTEQVGDNRPAVNYEVIAGQVGGKYPIKVYSGRTGLLSADDIRADNRLAMLYMRGYGQNNPVSLTRVLFGVEEIDAGELGAFDVPRPKMYETIGPVKDAAGRIMAVVRVVQAEKARAAEAIDTTLSKETITLDDAPAEAAENYSVKEKVTEDLKKLAAMQTVKANAEQFVRVVTEKGWEKAIEQFNELHTSQTDSTDKTASESEPFRLQTFPSVRRVSKDTLDTVAAQTSGDPMAQYMLKYSSKERLLVDKFYSLLGEGQDQRQSASLIVEFKPDMSYYVVKNISINRIDQQQYEQMKGPRTFREDIVQSQSLAAVHFGPANILKRMDFRLVENLNQTLDPVPPQQADSGGQ
ncbi:MAG TPA: hypothetical protein VMW23_00460 [Sedimentisphaerales bacterium]|nr:hypothetical protein [Sedimentisphaerales bacterium]